MTTDLIKVAIENFRIFAEMRFTQNYASEFEHLRNTRFAVSYGNRYARVDVIERNGSKRVFAFIDKNTGEIFKPATFRKPAAHARGNVLSEQNGMEAVTSDGIGIRYLRH